MFCSGVVGSGIIREARGADKVTLGVSFNSHNN